MNFGYWQGRFVVCAFVGGFLGVKRPSNSWGVATNPIRDAVPCPLRAIELVVFPLLFPRVYPLLALEGEGGERKPIRPNSDTFPQFTYAYLTFAGWSTATLRKRISAPASVTDCTG